MRVRLEVSTQVQRGASCNYLRVRLNRASNDEFVRRTFRYAPTREVPYFCLFFLLFFSSDVLNTHENNFLSSRNKWTTRSVKVREKSKEAALEALVDLAEVALR